MFTCNGSSFAFLRFSCVHSTRLCEKKGGLSPPAFLSDTFFRRNPLIKALVELTVTCFSERKCPYPPYFIPFLCTGITWLLQGLAVCSAGWEERGTCKEELSLEQYVPHPRNSHLFIWYPDISTFSGENSIADWCSWWKKCLIANNSKQKGKDGLLGMCSSFVKWLT